MILTNLTDYWRLLRSSYWFIPSLMVVASVVLALSLGSVDNWLGGNWLREVSFLVDNQPEGARAILSAIAGSMITVAGVTFSMTMVAVSSAASQFGPRLVGNFMRDTGNQITLGVFIATFVYCLVVLRTVRNASDLGTETELASFVPHASILVALVLALACVAVLIYFIHHIPETINVANITASVGRQLKNDIAQMFPEKAGESFDSKKSEFNDAEMQDQFAGSRQLIAHEEGYIVTVDIQAITELAIEHDCVIRLMYRPGDFIVSDDVLLYISGKVAEDCSDQDKRLYNCFSIGVKRTPDQNLLFLADQLVEIMVRALSPGVNDPFTALNCLHWLTIGLVEMSAREIPSMNRYDERKQLRLVAEPVGFEQFCTVVFDQSMQYVSGDRNAALEMMRMITKAALSSPFDSRKRSLLKYAEQLRSASLNQLPLQQDRDEVASCYEQVILLAKEGAPKNGLKTALTRPGSH